MSFGGLTKVASIAEEVRNPGKNLASGMILAWFVVTAFYISVIVITLGVVDGRELSGSLLPISLAASKDERNYHLRALVAIAQVAQEKQFEERWHAARDTEAIRNLILFSTRKRDSKA